MLSSIRTNNSTPEQVLTASALIQSEYPKLTLGQLQEIVMDGLLQKFNETKFPQSNEITSLMFWLRQWKIDKMQVNW